MWLGQIDERKWHDIEDPNHERRSLVGNFKRAGSVCMCAWSSLVFVPVNPLCVSVNACHFLLHVYSVVTIERTLNKWSIIFAFHWCVALMWNKKESHQHFVIFYPLLMKRSNKKVHSVDVRRECRSICLGRISICSAICSYLKFSVKELNKIGKLCGNW